MAEVSIVFLGKPLSDVTLNFTSITAPTKLFSYWTIETVTEKEPIRPAKMYIPESVIQVITIVDDEEDEHEQELKENKKTDVKLAFQPSEVSSVWDEPSYEPAFTKVPSLWGRKNSADGVAGRGVQLHPRELIETGPDNN